MSNKEDERQNAKTADHDPALNDDQCGAKADLSPRERGTVFGNYTLLQVIGTGGMGQVWKAEEKYPRRTVALKLIKPQLFAHQSADERARTLRRFRSEIETAGKLEHPNIVPLYHAGQEDGRLYYTMQYVEGRSPLLSLRGVQPTIDLQDTPANQSETSRDGPGECPTSPQAEAGAGAVFRSDPGEVRWMKAAMYVGEASRGLAYAHNRGIIHRDIKPDNIIVDDSTDTARITDFGLAKALQESTIFEIPTDYRAGTRGYMAPEQEIDAGRATAQSDIYGLGATLMALLTGTPPTRPAEKDDAFADICAPHRENVPQDLQSICLTCLQQDPDRRYQSANEVADDLQRFQEVRPVTARPVGRIEQLRYWMRRSRSLAAVGLAAILLGLAVIIGGPVAWYLNFSARHATELERQERRIEELEKRRAQEQARLAQANVFLQQARTARGRGDWLAVLERLDDAEDLGHPDPVMITIDRARARRSLGQIPQWIEAVAALAEKTDLAEHRGPVLLMQGDVARFQGQSVRSIELTQQALAAGLPMIEELYAQAVLAETTPECVDVLTRAVERDPYHYDATMMLIATLVLSGHRNEAKQRAALAETLFADDAGFALWMAVLAAAESDRDEMDRHMTRVGEHLDEPTKRLVFVALEDLKTFSDRFNDLDLAKQNDLQMIWKFASLAIAVRRVYGQAGEHSSSLVGAARSLPPAFHRAYAPLLELSPTNIFTVVRKGTAAFIEPLAEASSRHPEGTLHLMRGSLLFSANRYAEAEQAFAAAAAAPAIIPGVQREAPMLAAAAANLVYWETDQDPECLERAVGYVRRRVREGPSRPFQSDLLLRIANLAGDDGLAQTIIWQVLEQYDDDVSWLLTVAEVELQHSKFDSATRALNQLQSLDPTNAKAQNLREQVRSQKQATSEQQCP